MHAERSIPRGCGCEGCRALAREAGEHAPLLMRKLPIRGWAGKLSDAERLWLNNHPPEWLLAGRRKALSMRAKLLTQRAPADPSALSAVVREQPAA